MKHVPQALVDFTPPEISAKAKVSGVMFSYACPLEESSRKQDRDGIHEHRVVLKPLLSLGRIWKTPLCDGLALYNKAIGSVLGGEKAGANLKQQAYALRKLLMDCERISANTTPGGRLPAWLRQLIQAWRVAPEDGGCEEDEDDGDDSYPAELPCEVAKNQLARNLGG